MSEQIDAASEYGIDVVPDKPAAKIESIRSIWSISDVPSICAAEVSEPTAIYKPIEPGRLYKDKMIRHNTDTGTSSKTPSVVDDSTIFRSDIKVQGTAEARTLSSTDLFAQNVTAATLTVSGATRIVQNSIYLEGAGGNSGITFTMTPDDAVDIIYANPINGVINIILGTKGDTFFANQVLTVKDVTLQHGPASSYNVNIWAAPSVKIEHYSNGGLTSEIGAAYSLNSSGGSVSLRYVSPRIRGSTPTWVIQDQFQGNPRLFGRAGIIFLPADEAEKMKLINFR
jgi:hypothetical protein